MESSKINGDLIWMICPTNFAESGGRCIRYPEDTLASVAINHSNYMNNFLPSANTAPVLSSISNITVNAGDTIVIAANASDLEGDTLSYNIDSSFFDKTGNIFTWQTSLYSAGNYSFRVTVNDGNLGDSQLVFVKVIGLKYNCTMPMDNMLITNNTLFCPGTYTILNSINVNKEGVLIN